MCCTCNASYNPNVSLSLMRFLGFEMSVLVKAIFKISATFKGSYERIAAFSHLRFLQGDMEDRFRHNYAFSSQCTRLFCDEEAPNEDMHNIDIAKYSWLTDSSTFGKRRHNWAVWRMINPRPVGVWRATRSVGGPICPPPPPLRSRERRNVATSGKRHWIALDVNSLKHVFFF